jgi:hypothetical protein
MKMKDILWVIGHSKEYYEFVNQALQEAQSQADCIAILQGIADMLQRGVLKL